MSYLYIMKGVPMFRLQFSTAAMTLVIAVLFLLGCGGGKSPVSPDVDIPGDTNDNKPAVTVQPAGPVNPANVQPREGEGEEPGLTGSNNGPKTIRDDRMYFGVWNIGIDPETHEVSIVPNRMLEAHYNVTAAVQPPNCPDCLGIKVLNFDPDTFVLSLDISLKNPTIALTGRDVRGTLLFPEGDNRVLVNADDYTTIFDNTDPADRNPFKAFAKGEVGRAFPPQAIFYEQYDIKFPPPANYNVLYVVDASWPNNQEEIYEINSIAIDGGINECNSAEGWLYADIHDWQSNATGIMVDLTPIGGEVVQMDHVLNTTYRTYINNETGAASGDYDIWFEATSENTDFSLYDKWQLNIPGCENSPPVWDDTIGVVSVTSIEGGLEVGFGTASDDDVPVFFNVYYSEDAPINWIDSPNIITVPGSPAEIPGLTDESTYWVGVRAVDALGNEEKNTVQMTGVPSVPPDWDTTVGIVAVNPGDQEMEVIYGTASDPQGPVTYNVYWSDTTPIDFGTANVMNDGASPTVVTGLDNFKPYYFAVRAVDSAGSEDKNTKQLTGTPNGPPEWVDTIGIQSTIPGNNQVTVTYGDGIDVDLPLTFNIYYDESSPIDFGSATKESTTDANQYTVGGLNNGQTYFFAVRIEDWTGVEETNTVELPGTPNAAPTWENDMIGVQGLVPFDHEVTVSYGHAIDTDLPITYYIFYSTSTPINFATADYETTMSESPYVVTGLDNFIPYYFAVRAEDSLGIRETNTVQLFTIPNPAPVWDGPVGIQTLDSETGALIAGYGTASDIDLPVSYRVYYSETSPINFGTAPYIEDPAGSPTSIGGLENGKTYYVAVRAVDSFGHEDQNTVTLSNVPQGHPEESWSVFTGGVVQGSPVLNDMNGDNILDVIIGDQAKKMVCYDGIDGSEVWNFPAAGWVDSSPALTQIGGDGTLDVVFGSLLNKVYAVNGATGVELWHADVGGAVIASPTLANITGDFHADVIVGCMDGTIYAFDGADGSLDWTFPTGAGVFSSPASADITGDFIPDIVVGSRDGNVYAINGASGAQIWSFPTGEWINSSPAMANINGDATLDVVIASLDGMVYAINGGTGAELWNFPTGDYVWASPAVANLGGDATPDIVIGADTSSVYALDGSDGSLMWEFESNDRVWSSAAIAELTGDLIPDVVVGSDDARLYAINGIDGSLVWTFETGDWIDSSPAVGDVNNDGLLDVAFGRYDGYVTMLNMPESAVGAIPWAMFRHDAMHSGVF
jgi:outer membrane protein assembly factor BamB